MSQGRANKPAVWNKTVPSIVPFQDLAQNWGGKLCVFFQGPAFCCHKVMSSKLFWTSVCAARQHLTLHPLMVHPGPALRDQRLPKQLLTGSVCGNKSQNSRKDAWGNIACVAKRLYNNTAVSGLAGKLICFWGFCSGMIVAVLLKTGICSSATATFLTQIKITASPNSLTSTFSNPIMHKGLDDGSWWLAAASPHVLRQTPAGWRTPGRVRMWFLSVKRFRPLNCSSSEAGNASAQECCFLLPLRSSDQHVTSGKRWWRQSREVCFTPGY